MSDNFLNNKARQNNDFLSFYGEHSISPVHQKISNMQIHLARREKLYRQLGIPRITFKNANMLEVGPGGGYNTLAFFEWGIKHIDLVEANKQGITDMQINFTNISKDRYEIFPCLIEEYRSNKKYDIVIAESFIQYLENQKDIINCLGNYTEKGGVVVITASDEVGFFIEQIKRLIAQVYVCDISIYEEKVRVLAELFAPQLAKLRGVSRPAEDWVQDQMLNPVAVNKYSLSLWEAIDYFGDEFDVLGTSPSIFTDYSWYKDIWYDYKSDYKYQFDQKNINLILANMKEEYKNEKNSELVEAVHKVKELCAKYEEVFDYSLIYEISDCVDDVVSIIDESDAGKELMCIMSEIQLVFKDLKKKDKVNLDKYPNFFSAFGRTQQYISFVRKEYNVNE